MKTEVIRSPEHPESLRQDWWALYRECPRATPFQSPQWLLPWIRHLYRGGEMQVLAIREGQTLIGLAPFFRWGVERQTLSFLGAGISDYGDILFAPDRESECGDAVWDFLSQQCRHGVAADLQEIRGGSCLLKGRNAEECSVCPVLELSTYPQTMDAKLRTDLRRARNKLTRLSKLRLERATEETLAGCMQEFFRLYAARWGGFDESPGQFHMAAAENFLRAGMLRLYLLRADELAVAAVYAFASGTTLYCYLSGFDPAFAKLSPGAVLLEWVIEDVMREGFTEVDFLRHPEAYKYLWGARDRVNYKIAFRS